MRAVLGDAHHDFARRRAIPSIYVVDEHLRILWSRPDPDERRRECISEGDALPPLVSATVRRLLVLREQMDPPPDTLVNAAGASLLVRVIWLTGRTHAMAILVERFRIRDYLAGARKRFALTERETQVLTLVVDGLTNEEIGARLTISKSTAVFHVKRLLSKMEVRNRTELVTRFLS